MHCLKYLLIQFVLTILKPVNVMTTQETAQFMRTAKVEAFDKWMRDTVKSIHYENNERMERAFNRVIEKK